MAVDPFEIPQQLRDTAEQSVEQAKEAFDQFVDATQKAVASNEGVAKAVTENAADLNREVFASLEDNVAATLELAKRVVQARTVQEITALQQEFLQRRAAAATRQGEEMGKMVSRVMSEVTDKK